MRYVDVRIITYKGEPPGGETLAVLRRLEWYGQSYRHKRRTSSRVFRPEA